MKKTIKRALSVLLCAALLLGAAPLLAFAADPTSGSCGSGVTWSYNASTKTLTISGSGEMNSYESSNYGQYNVPVTTAPWKPYYMSMKHVVIESGVTAIGANAFYMCMSMESVAIPGTVAIIRDNAFAGCPNLTAVKISDVAAWCGVTFATVISNPLYYGHNLYLNDSPATDLVIPSGVTSVGQYAFYNCSNITGLTVPEGVTTINSYAFMCCSGLTDINLPDGIETIGSGAFQSCTGLTDVTLPNSITNLGSMAFSYCCGLTSINIPDGVSYINSSTFNCCVNLASVTIGSGVIEIYDNAFAVSCDADMLSHLQSDYDQAVTYGETMVDGTIGYVPLAAIRTILDNPAGSLTDVYYRGTEDNWNLIEINAANDALVNATKHFAPGFMGLVYLEAADSTISIIECDDWLTEIAIPAGIDGGTVTTIGNNAFKGNNLMTSVTIPRTVTAIGSGIFQVTPPDFYHSYLESSINSLINTYASYGYGPDYVKSYIQGEWERNGPYWAGTVRYDEAIYYVDHGAWPTTSLTDVYFEGTEEEWNRIAIDPDNAILLGATIHFLDVEHSHSYVSSYTAPTCTADGARTYTCACGDVITQTLKALGHDYTSEVTQEATCAAPGVRTYTCSNCGGTYTESIPALAHTYESVTTKEPTCTETGTLTKTCTECHFVTTEVIPARGHSFEMQVTKEPTCTEEGSCIKTCTRCQYSCTEALPRADHTDEDDDGVCDVCGSEDIGKSDIEVGETKTVTIEQSGQTVLLCFVPKLTGTYTLASGANADTYGHLYDADMNEIAYNDDYGTQIGTDFALTYYLVKGQTYYYGCRYYYRYRTGSFPVTLTLDSALETLDAAAGTNTVVDTMNGVIYGLAPQMTDPSDYFVTKSDYTSTITPSGQNGETDIYSTGSLVKVYSGSTMVASYKLVVFGDINGDGWYDGTDAYFVSLLANGTLPQTALNAAQRKACDANHDGAIDAADVAILEQAGLLLNEVDQTLTQEELQTNSVYLEYCGLIDQMIETIGPDEEQPIVVERLQPESQTVWGWIKALFSVVLNWLLGILKTA